MAEDEMPDFYDLEPLDERQLEGRVEALFGYFHSDRAAMEIEDAAALAQARLDQERRVKPQLIYRCSSRRRCGLFTVWNHP
ncbi:MAG: hypothetical protein QOK10_3619, partial [Pseudonocardiales bacterium]|nr:hypothetical protein [Pseudonocardiales bacterium]